MFDWAIANLSRRKRGGGYLNTDVTSTVSSADHCPFIEGITLGFRFVQNAN